MTATPLPTIAQIATAPSTHGVVRAAVAAQRNYLAGLLGVDGTTATALATLGVTLSTYLGQTTALSVTTDMRGTLVAASGTWALTLPAASSAGAAWGIAVKNNGSGTITLTRAGSDLIDGAASVALAAGMSAFIVCSGTGWVTIQCTGALATTTVAGLMAATDKAKIDGNDTLLILQNTTTTTKKGRFDLAPVSTGVTRVWSMPNMDATLAVHAFFASRSTALTFLGSANLADGSVIVVNGLAFRKKTGATAISDMADWLPALDIYADHFGENAIPGTTDMSTFIQAALTYVGGIGGGFVRLLASIYIAKELSCPNQTVLAGQGKDATVLKLKNGANSYLFASSNWIANVTYCNLYGGAVDLTMDGNVANNATGSLAWFTSYRAIFKRVKFQNSGGAGLVLSAIMRDGTTLLANHMAETQVTECDFDTNTGHGLWAKDGAANRVADQEICYNHFNGNGGAGIYAERCNGWKIIGNQIYGNGTYGLYADEFARSTIQTNNIELLASAITAGNVAGCIHINTFSSQGSWTISGNSLIINIAADTTTKTLAGLAIIGTTSDGGSIGQNPMVDLSSGGLAKAVYLSTAALASLAKIDLAILGTGPLGLLSRNELNLALTDATDPTKRSILHMSASHPTATDLDFYFPPVTGTLAILERSNQTFSGNMTVQGKLKSTSSNPLGYDAGAGGTVTQATSKTTTVTLNKASGEITTNAAALAAGAAVQFTVNCSVIPASPATAVVVPNVQSPSGKYRVAVVGVSTTAYVLELTNITAGSLSEAVVITVAVIAAATT